MIRFLTEPRLEPWRSWLLGFAYASLTLAGALALFQGDLSGASLMVLAGLGMVLLHRRVYHLLVWLAVAVIGYLQLSWATTTIGGVLVALGIGMALIGVIGTGTRRTIAAVDAPQPADSAPVDLVPTPVSVEVAEPATAIERTPVVVPTEMAQTHDPDSGLVVMRSIGPLSVIAGGIDYGSRLGGREEIAFVFLYLYTRALCNPEEEIERYELANESSPGYPRDHQFDQLRRRLKILGDLSPELAACLIAGRSHIRFNLSAVRSDVTDLRQLSRLVKEGGGLLDEAQLAEVGGLIEKRMQHDYLPGWEALETAVARGRGTSSDFVERVRREVEANKCVLACAYGATMISRGNPIAALDLLETAHAVHGENEQLYEILLEATTRAGKVERAVDLRRRFASGEVS